MASITLMQLPPPSDWQNFERLCRDLWALLLEDKNTQRNGRNGQPQCGVDVYGVDSAGKRYGIQCKGKDNYTNATVTEKELRNEVEKAKKFKPGIDHFILATTGPKDTNLERVAREITATQNETNSFSVHFFGWTDVIERLEQYPELVKKYYHLLINDRDKAHRFFKAWSKLVSYSKMSTHCNFLPSGQFSVRFSRPYILSLESYFYKINEILKDPHWQDLPSNVKIAITNFNRVIKDLIATCWQYESKMDNEGIVTYWISADHLAYEQQGKYIEYRKNVLRAVFYQTILAANYVAKTVNACLSDIQIDYIGFTEEFPYNHPIFGDPHPSPETFPMYPEDDVLTGNLYLGLIATDYHIRDQIYPPKPPCF
ncbi:hypothetical protein NUH87_28490 [Pseudomonas batumici]|uniref:hypothetical protein n=1 Tax=Pseudomonas batumici TaxID=226910 RepID=UPI0030D61277